MEYGTYSDENDTLVIRGENGELYILLENRIKDIEELHEKSKRTGRRQPTKDCPRPVLCRCVFDICYAVERHFEGIRYKTLAASFSSTESPVNQGFFCPYCVTRARRFLMRSAACLRVIRFRQSGQYLTLLEVDAKEAPHSVQRFLYSVLKTSAYSSLSRGSTAV